MRAIRTRAFLAVAATTVALTAAPPVAADPAGTFVEPVTILHEIRKHTGRSFYGWAVSELGDVDGDGVMEVLTGAPFGDTRGGVVDVYSGRTGERLRSAVGTKGDLLSYAQADAGDTDGDGAPDYVVGAPGNGAGHALVFSGATGEVVLRLDGEAGGDFFGAAVAAAGDVNGDGRADVLVGAPGADAAGVNSGRAYVFSGADGSLVRSLDGPSEGALFGSGTDWMPDVTGDGIPDHIVGARNAGPEGAGEVRVFSGADGAPVWTAGPDPSGNDLGWFFVAGVGDVNGDGTPDVYGGDFTDDALGPDTGRAYVFSGVDGSVLRRFLGSSAGQGLGPGREAGDVDADGRPDLVVGSYLSSDGANGAGKVQVFSGADGSVLRTITSTRAHEQLGFDAVGLGDVSGDGVPDQVLSAANRNTLYVVAGEAP